VTLHAPRLPFSLDPMIAAAMRRAMHRRALVAVLIIAAAGAAVGIALTLPWSGGGTQTGPMRRYTFTVEAVNSSRVVNDVSYVSLSSAVVLPRKKLTRAPLFDITGGFYLTAASPRGSVLCSFEKRITDSATFPNANGETVTVKVYGRRAPPSLTARICTAFESFSLSSVQRH
jgi:hypothetical protein